MKFDFENLGNVDNGTVELGDLTLICGPNNAGKTYISYAIYGFLRHFKKWVDLSISHGQLAQLRSKGTVVVELQDYQEKLADCLKTASGDFSESLPDYFKVPAEFFQEAKVKFSHDSLHFNFEEEFRSAIRFGRSEHLNFYKAKEEMSLAITLQTRGDTKGKSLIPDRVLNDNISNQITAMLFSDLLPSPFVVTSERTGIALFYKELDISKNAIIERITGNGNFDLFDILSSIRSRYAQPIHDNINVVRDYENLSKKKSFIREDAQTYKPIREALQDLMGGSYKVVNKQVMYIPRKEKNRSQTPVPFYVASSSIKSLFLIELYINSLAEKNGMLIIDEPELNLHPDNQRKMAGLLARLANAGIKVLVTTHSDYLIREINNRIMLNLDIEDKKNIMKQAKITEDDILLPEQVKAYSLKGEHKIEPAVVDKYGINTEVFDCLIEEANELADSIYYNIK